jgi:hypothetical protein
MPGIEPGCAVLQSNCFSTIHAAWAVSIEAVPYDFDLVRAYGHRFRGFSALAPGGEPGTHNYENSHVHTHTYPQ